MIYLYALLDTADPPRTDALEGVTGPVLATRIDRRWLIHGPAGSDEILPRRRLMLAHARVQEALMDQGTLLPMRFGMLAQDLPRVTAMVLAREGAIDAAVDRLRDRVELGLRIAFPRPQALEAAITATPALAAERDRLRRLPRAPHFAVAEFGRRLADTLDQRRGAVQRKLVAALRGDWVDHVLNRPESDVDVLSVECLVARDRVDAVAEAALAQARALADFAAGADPVVRVIGPLPAYTFANLSLDPAPQEETA